MSQENRLPGSDWSLMRREGEQNLSQAGTGVLSELCVDKWLKLKQMNDHLWWIRVGDARLMVGVDDEGRATVDILRGFYADILGSTGEWDGSSGGGD